MRNPFQKVEISAPPFILFEEALQKPVRDEKSFIIKKVEIWAFPLILWENALQKTARNEKM